MERGLLHGGIVCRGACECVYVCVCVCVCCFCHGLTTPTGFPPIDRKSTGPGPTHNPNQPEKRGTPKREHTTQNVTGTLCRRAPRRKGAKPTMQQSHRTTTRATGPRPQNHRGGCFGLPSKNDPEKSAEKHTPTYSTLPQALSKARRLCEAP